MKVRPLFILLLFVLSTGVLTWIYYAATRKHEHRPAPKPRQTETLADLDACGRRKHAKSMQYEYFADIAHRERQEHTARLFRAMALSERVHEGICAEAIVRLGGHYEPPVKVIVFRGTTDGNLERSLRYEQQSLDTRSGKEIHRAMSAGNRYAAQILARADAGDRQHIILLEQSLNRRHPQDTIRTYTVCPVCGNLALTEHEPDFCPYCLTERGRFVQFY